MRIVIAGPPKTGNVWTKCMIASAYGLRVLATADIPANGEVDVVAAWLAGGNFPDNAIFHQHLKYSPEIADLIAGIPAHLITVIRDPYDAFVSTYSALEVRPEAEVAGQKRLARLAGEPIDSPLVYRYLKRGGYRANLENSVAWVQSGRSIVVRYEAFHADPIAELSRVTAVIGEVPSARLEHAVDYCRADNMRQLSDQMQKHVRTATVGESHRRLNDTHLEIMRAVHGDLIRALGYEVR